MPQLKSVRRLWQPLPAALFMANAPPAANGRATAPETKQLTQSDSRGVGAAAAGSCGGSVSRTFRSFLQPSAGRRGEPGNPTGQTTLGACKVRSDLWIITHRGGHHAGPGHQGTRPDVDLGLDRLARLRR